MRDQMPAYIRIAYVLFLEVRALHLWVELHKTLTIRMNMGGGVVMKMIPMMMMKRRRLTLESDYEMIVIMTMAIKMMVMMTMRRIKMIMMTMMTFMM